MPQQERIFDRKRHAHREDLAGEHRIGDDYTTYMREVPMLLPRFRGQ